MTYFAKPGVPAVTPVTFPLVFVFSAGQAGCTGSHFCLTVAGHQVFDEEQQQLIAGMSPATIQLAWQSTAGETPGAVLSVGRHRVGLSDNDITVYRFAPRDEAWPQDSDWDRLLYTVFKGEASDKAGWQCVPFSLSELSCHGEFARLTCRGAILKGAGGVIS
ncbi:hypothetical protein [Proteus sp. G2665]|uniref:hypothetical protein n=1 Tax=Proteus sp. G2665 TaxID=2698878 RepID=UPI001377CA03|nr:hypothetical protein [Proteus sp. G2665]